MWKLNVYRVKCDLNAHDRDITKIIVDNTNSYLLSKGKIGKIVFFKIVAVG